MNVHSSRPRPTAPGLAPVLWCWTLLLAALTVDANGDIGFITLGGLQSVKVEVDGVHRDFARFGFTAESVREKIIAQLARDGIAIADQAEFRTAPHAALLRVKIRTNENQYRFYHYGVSLELIRKIPLNNAAGGFVADTSWRRGQTGIVMPTDLRNLNGVIATLLSEFIADFRSQNGPLALSLRD